jgi:3-oxoadipate CoA-transferase alpha subunit
MKKVFDSAAEALKDVFDGAVILCGGFGHVGGTPSILYRALSQMPVKNLTLVGNSPILGVMFHKAAARTMKVPDWFVDGSLLIQNRQVSKVIVSVPALAIAKMPEPFPIIKALQEGQNIEVEMVPQGTMAERIRAAKAGILAFYTPTGAGTYAERGKETKIYEGQKYLLEYALKADFAIIAANKADPFGNLVYRGTSRTFNATMAGAARTTVVEVNQVVKLGDLDPEAVVTPGIYVDRIVARGGSAK